MTFGHNYKVLQHGEESVFLLKEGRWSVTLPLVVERTKHDAEVLGRTGLGLLGVGSRPRRLEHSLNHGVFLRGPSD